TSPRPGPAAPRARPGRPAATRGSPSGRRARRPPRPRAPCPSTASAPATQGPAAGPSTRATPTPPPPPPPPPPPSPTPPPPPPPGAFPLRVAAFVGDAAGARLAYGAIASETNTRRLPSQAALPTAQVRLIGPGETVARNTPFLRREAFNRLTVQAEPGKVRFL